MSDSVKEPVAPSVPAPFFTLPRMAVSLLFLMNGFMVGAWAPKIPEFAERLHLNKTELGLMILLLGVGSLTFMPIAGIVMARTGSRPVTLGFALLMLPSLLFLTFAPTIPLAAIAIFWFGGAMGAMDASMNTNAVATEKAMGRAIMSSCHAFWSLGGVIGSASGGLLITYAGVGWHAMIATAFAVAVLALAFPFVQKDPPHPQEEGAPRRGLPLQLTPWLFGIMALFSMVPEGAVLDWGALYVRQELGASLAASGLAFAAFSGTMALMRFLGDLVRDRYGAVKTLRVSASFAIIGMLIAGLAPSAPYAIAGFALCGLGIANMVPIAFSAAGNMPGVAPGIGLSLATFMGYSGLLAAPSLIGFTAEHTGFKPIYLFLPVLFAVVLLLSPLARHADQIRN